MAPPTRGPTGPMERGGGPGKSGTVWKAWAGWAKIQGEFYNIFGFSISMDFEFRQDFGNLYKEI
jgi:hypothetical protein